VLPRCLVLVVFSNSSSLNFGVIAMFFIKFGLFDLLTSSDSRLLLCVDTNLNMADRSTSLFSRFTTLEDRLAFSKLNVAILAKRSSYSLSMLAISRSRIHNHFLNSVSSLYHVELVKHQFYICCKWNIYVYSRTRTRFVEYYRNSFAVPQNYQETKTGHPGNVVQRYIVNP
jgi:hypothetical protein